MTLLADAIRDVLGHASYELTDLGLYCHRNVAPTGSLRAAEAVLLGHRAVRVMDFTHDDTLLGENVVPRDGADPADYEGIAAPSGHRLFRVDHHYAVPSLASVSTTPLALRWIRGLWERGRSDLLREVAGSLYVADHADADILLANFLAANARDEALIRGPVARWLEAAALRNDHVLPPPAELEPQASRAFHACVGIERAVLEGHLGFSEAQRIVLPELVRWLGGEPVRDAKSRRDLEGWERETRARQQGVLDRIEQWSRQGALGWELDGRLAILEADDKIDNADLFLYLSRTARAPVVQALIYPAPGAGEGKVTVKLRAHGGFDLYPLYRRLLEIAPDSRFDGRSAAGGSKPFGGIARDRLVAAVREALQDAGLEC